MARSATLLLMMPTMVVAFVGAGAYHGPLRLATRRACPSLMKIRMIQAEGQLESQPQDKEDLAMQLATMDRRIASIDQQIDSLRVDKRALLRERRSLADVYDELRFEVANREWNGPILLTLTTAAFTATFWKYILVVSSLYQNDAFMEANWLPESLKLVVAIPGKLLAEYGQAAAEWPLFTMAATSAVSYAIGDLVAQRVEGRWRAGLLDLSRTGRATMLGFVLHGPLLSAWIRLLEQTLFANGAEEWTTLLAKIALDQTLFALTINMLYAFLTELLNDKQPSEAFERAQALLLPSMLSSWRFWPAVHLISYSPLIPLDYKLLWIDVMEVVWVAILSVLVNANPSKGECKTVEWGEGKLVEVTECPLPLVEEEAERRPATE